MSDQRVRVAKALKENKTLVSVKLGGNSIDDDVMRELAKALEENTTLESVDVMNCKLKESLRENAVVEQLSLMGNNVNAKALDL